MGFLVFVLPAYGGRQNTFAKPQPRLGYTNREYLCLIQPVILL